MSHFCNAHGDAVTADEAVDARGHLRNGYGMRVPIYMMDGWQRDVAEHFADRKRRRKVKEEEDVWERHHKRCSTGDAAVGFIDARGVYFPPDPRMIAARDAVDHLEGREEMLRQMWRDGRAAAEEARQQMIDEASNAWRNHSGQRSNDATPPSPPRIMRLGDARRVKDEAYLHMVRDGENAWRRGK